MKKIILSSLVFASAFAVEPAFNYEITPIIGGVIPNKASELDNQIQAGIRVSRNLKDVFFDQLELGYDSSYRYSKLDKSKKIQNNYADRYFINLNKNLFDFGNKFGVYTLIGAGHESFNSEIVNPIDHSGFAQYGFGARLQFSDRLALKAEARHAFRFNDKNQNFFYSLGLGFSFGAKKHEALNANETIDNNLSHDNEATCNENSKEVVLDEVNDKETFIDNEVNNENIDKEDKIVLEDFDLNFVKNSAKINNKYKKEIKKISDFLNSNSEYSVVLEGYADSTGKESYNQKLSLKRAEAVADVLKSHGIQDSRISTIGHGEANPVASNDTKEGRALNRRVEAKFVK